MNIGNPRYSLSVVETLDTLIIEYQRDENRQVSRLTIFRSVLGLLFLVFFTPLVVTSANIDVNNYLVLILVIGGFWVLALVTSYVLLVQYIDARLNFEQIVLNDYSIQIEKSNTKKLRYRKIYRLKAKSCFHTLSVGDPPLIDNAISFSGSQFIAQLNAHGFLRELLLSSLTRWFCRGISTEDVLEIRKRICDKFPHYDYLKT